MDKETIARYAASLDTLLNKDENGVEFCYIWWFLGLV